ncbi:rhamnogalacturonan acetylesterase [Asticcacaulis sp. ZE23SCel15]|uniref:rhamnogalacturonan acetylesterase n=1 Tax=Asticcacaulis sp. ZE23SCel15 TaxID=3059027 RepID=UPI00265FAD8B|nr:rhamnogalacturonan acetylesterase [Asticcacaulis sp. ZE23SCel15]WKL57137.1 rhamnogalacturonan acetylesterase [Asticcacaulis sp. ZE23SCel15]
MMKWLILLAALYAGGAAAQTPAAPPVLTDAEARAQVKKITAKKIVLVGDSTTAVVGGWGPSFCGYHLTSFTACVNLARGGRSTFNYRAEGSWDIALAEMKSGGFAKTYVLIQFGHNDQPGKPGRSTDLKTEFPQNLAAYVTEVRAAGAIPVLVTPLTRRGFKDGKVENDLGPWAEATRAVAKEMNVPLVDLYARSQEAVQAMGAAEAMKFAQKPPSPQVLEAGKTGTTIAGSTGVAPAPNAPPMTEAQIRDSLEPMGQAKLSFDYTHLGRDGADFFAKIVTRELAAAVPDLRRDLIP